MKTASNSKKSRASVESKMPPQAAPRRTSSSPAEFQTFGTLVRLPNGLSEEACESSVKALNQMLADTITLCELYKKHHWQVSGPTFIQLHELYDRHFEAQSGMVDQLAERIQVLGGVSVAMGGDVAEMTQIARPPMGREPAPNQISRLLQAHQQLLNTCHEAAGKAEEAGDDGTNDLLMDVIRANEFQVWFLSQHLVPTPVSGPAGTTGGSADIKVQ